MAVDSKPEALDEIDRRLVQLKIEREALQQGDRRGLQGSGWRTWKSRSSDLQAQSDEMTARWQRREGQGRGSAAQAREALDRLRAELGQPPSAGATSPAPVRDPVRRDPGAGEAPGRGREPAETAQRPDGCPEVVDAEQIAAVVSRWTGVPVEKMLEGEREKLLKMEDTLRGRVVGQDEALDAVADAVRRARAGLHDRQPPDRRVPVPGPHGRRQDRADQGPGRVHVRRRAGDHPHRHVASTWRSTRSAA